MFGKFRAREKEFRFVSYDLYSKAKNKHPRERCEDGFYSSLPFMHTEDIGRQYGRTLGKIKKIGNRKISLRFYLGRFLGQSYH